LTAEQLEAARAERMRQNGHGAITIEDVRTWIEETGLCIFLPRSAQAGQPIQAGLTAATPTFVEAVAGQRTTEPTLELITAAESLLVRLEAEGVAVRLNLAGQPGDQPDYVVAGWVLPYIYALRGDRDWRRSPQLTGSRQVSQLAVLAAKQLDSANMTSAQIRDALGREVTETAVLRALHELWKQLRIIPVVPEVGQPALWQPLRQRFQKAIAEGASTSQVTAISVLASIYLQAVIAASMEDVEMFLSPLTSRSKIREVVRGLAATRQVHSTTMGHSPMYYVAGTLPEFPVAPSFQIGPAIPSYRGSAYLASYLGHDHDDELYDASQDKASAALVDAAQPAVAAQLHIAEPSAAQAPHSSVSQSRPRPAAAAAHSGKTPASGKSAAPRPRAGDRRRAPMPRSTNGNGARSSASSTGSARPARSSSVSKSNGSHTAKPAHGASNGHAHNGNGSHTANGNHRANGAKPAHWAARPASNGNGAKSSAGARPASRPGGRTENRPGAGKLHPAGAGAKSHPVSKFKVAPKAGPKSTNGHGAHAESSNRSARPTARPGARPAAGKRTAPESTSRKTTASAAKRYSFSGQAKQAPKPAAKRTSGRASAPVSKAVAQSAVKSRSKSAHPAGSKRRG
jgi:23S rRNA pseudouridine2605 synthase